MLGKNNLCGKIEQGIGRRQSFALRRLKIGLVSVMAGVFLIGANTVMASEVVTSENTEVAETQVVDAEDEGEEEAGLSEEQKAQVEEARKQVGNDPTLETLDLAIEEDETYGDQAYKHMQTLSQEIGSRETGTIGEKEAREYIINELTSYGYEPESQDFTFTRKEKDYESKNIIAFKKGEVLKEVIIGAHYDSVPDEGSQGADDNASSIGILLETAERLKDIETYYSIRFIAFGGEEKGLQGSTYYVENMTQEEIDNTVGMVNMDSLIAGDEMYIHAGLDGDHWFANQAFDISEKLGFEMEPNPGLNPDYPLGETGDWSDHEPFNQVGIPIMYFEGSNWEIDDLDGYSQTVKFGPVWHTGNDNLRILNREFPGRAEEHLHAYSATLYNLLINMRAPEDKPVAQTPETNNQAGIVINKKVQAASKETVAKLPATGESSLITGISYLFTSLGLAGLVTNKKRD